MNCRLCSYVTSKLFTSVILHKYDIEYFLCPKCHLIQTEEPYWLEEAYSNPISILDTGILQRNYLHLRYILFSLTETKYKYPSFFENYFPKSIMWKKYNNNFLDYGGGYGILVRLLRDVGINAYHYDKYTKNLFANGFDLISDFNYDSLGCFELLEHLTRPLDELSTIINKYKPNFIFISTKIYGNIVPNRDWWYYTFETGQHISFYSVETFRYLSKKFTFFYYQLNEDFHIFSKKELDINMISKRILNEKSKLYHFLKKSYSSLTFDDHINLKDNLKNFI